MQPPLIPQLPTSSCRGRLGSHQRGLQPYWFLCPHRGPLTRNQRLRGEGSRPRDTALSFPGQPSCPLPWKATQASVTKLEGTLTTGEAYRLLAGGADEATGAGSALGYVYVDFCL